MASKKKKKKSKQTKEQASPVVNSDGLSEETAAQAEETSADTVEAQEPETEEVSVAESEKSEPTTQTNESQDEEVVNPAYRQRSGLLAYAGVTARGVLMGGADVIPGVSGGTMALIVGIYRELVASIQSIGIEALRLLMKGRIAQLSRHINLPFLIALVIGIGAAIVSLARVMPKLLRTYPAPVNGLFFGLILASIVIVWRQVKEYNFQNTVLLVLGAVGAYLLVGLIPVETSNSYAFIFLCGMVAICAMILPGISGSFILLLLGKYAFILNSLYMVTRHRKVDEHLIVVLVFMAGCACGLMAFSRVLNWMLDRFHAATLAVLTGLMLGSLRKIWPFQAPSEEMKGVDFMASNYLFPFKTDVVHYVQKKGLFMENIWPTQWNGQYVLAIVLALFGIVFVFTIDRLAQNRDAH
jgi:putative membrane protein